MGFFSAVKKIFGASESTPRERQGVAGQERTGAAAVDSVSDDELTLALREAEPRLSAWLGVVLQGVSEADDLLWRRLSFLLKALETPDGEAKAFADDFRDWLGRMDYRYLEDFRSELQYRLALALDMEDEEDERDRLFLKLNEGLARTRAQFGKGLNALFAGHSSLSPQFWEEMEELFIMADMGAESALALVETLRERAGTEGVSSPAELLPILQDEVEKLFRAPRRISAVLSSNCLRHSAAAIPQQQTAIRA